MNDSSQRIKLIDARSVSPKPTLIVPQQVFQTQTKSLWKYHLKQFRRCRLKSKDWLPLS